MGAGERLPGRSSRFRTVSVTLLTTGEAGLTTTPPERVAQPVEQLTFNQ
jgi:hypothetical protein